MRRIVVVLVVLILSTLACGLFSGDEGEETPAEIAPTETQEVSGAMEQTEMPQDIEPTERADTPLATETPRKTKKDVPIATKQSASELVPTQVAQLPISDELPEDYEEFFFPYEVAQYKGGVEITVTDIRILKQTYGNRHTIIGVIKNTGTVDLYNITVYIVALDKDGVNIHNSYFAAGVTNFPIGANNYFFGSTAWEALPEETESLFIFFDGMERWEGTSNTQNFEIVSVEGQPGIDDLWGDVYTFTVSFRNDDRKTTRFITMDAILYDKNNRVVGYGYSVREDWSDEGNAAGNKELQPGEIGEISFTCRSVYGTVDHYELFIEGSTIF